MDSSLSRLYPGMVSSGVLLIIVELPHVSLDAAQNATEEEQNPLTDRRSRGIAQLALNDYWINGVFFDYHVHVLSVARNHLMSTIQVLTLFALPTECRLRRFHICILFAALYQLIFKNKNLD